MTKMEERAQRLMINRAYENGRKAGYEDGFKDGMDKAIDIFAKRLAESDEEAKSSEETLESGGDN